jgi:hypothetical protein
VTPRYVVRKAEDISGRPIPADEPCLVVRGQDVLAPTMLRLYIRLYRDSEFYDQKVVDELRDHLQRLADWQAANAGYVKLADRE